MNRLRRTTRFGTVAVALSAAGVLLAGCSTQNNAGGMMAGNSGNSGGARMGQAGMMGRGYTAASMSCAAPDSLPGARVEVVLGDMGMSRMMGGTALMGARMVLRAAPATVPTGQVSFAVENQGWRTHELVILPMMAMTAGQRVPSADGKVDEAGSLGEASSTCAAGAGEGIASGSAGWVTITLAPGHYELVCNLTNHYANGMHQELVVTT